MGLVLLLACSQGFGDQVGDPTVLDWGGPPGSWLTLAPVGAPDDEPLQIRIDDGLWDMRLGELWRTASEAQVAPVEVDSDGYWADDSLLLPAGLSKGDSAQGTTITSRGEVEVWYGSFPDALSVDIGSGAFAGEAAFVVEHGPIRLSWRGVDWELVSYELE